MSHPALPGESHDDVVELRDRFAIAALAGYRAYGAWQVAIGADGHPSEQRGRPATPEAVARWSYLDADAMLVERAK